MHVSVRIKLEKLRENILLEARAYCKIKIKIGIMRGMNDGSSRFSLKNQDTKESARGRARGGTRADIGDSQERERDGITGSKEKWEASCSSHGFRRWFSRGRKWRSHQSV